VTSAGDPAIDPVDQWMFVLRGGRAGGMSVATALGLVPEEHREAVEARYRASVVVVEPVAVISEGGRRAWADEHDTSTGYHWLRLREFLLIERGRSESVVGSLDDSTDEILAMLEDPREGGPDAFQVRGLVVGHVQSGKTANFSALIAKSVDAGYRIVIVLSGLHNSLRRQTQLRLEDELGLVESRPPNRPAVGLATDGEQISRMTGPGTWQDFHPGTADANLLQGNARLILVVKKNASVLRRLVTWLEERQPVRPPVLIIDDEADQATINTGGNRIPLGDALDLSDDDVDGRPRDARAANEESSPTAINKLIRRMLLRMNRASYVGYTATPFANVLIDMDAVDVEVGADMYPADFIVSLPKPPGYVGTEDLFGRAAMPGEDDGVAPLDVIREVPDADADLVLPRRGGAAVTVLPTSLKTALVDFVLAMAGRDTRTGGRPATAMLVHASMYTAQQVTLADLVREELRLLRSEWRYDRDTALPRLRERWETEFVPVSAAMGPDRVHAWEDVGPALDRILREGVPVLVLNTATDDDLDYEVHPDIRAVVVGGNKLSRGLTIEGLVTSYYVRPANYYDTLLQMGRWFGYRRDYVDLTRLHTTAELRRRFLDLATSEEALRREIRLYDVENKTPRDFAPRIMAHATMQITARNRMGSGRDVSADYSGSLIQTINFQLGRTAWLEDNLEAARGLLTLLGPPNDDDPVGGPLTWRDVSWREIAAFLDRYKTHEGAQKVNNRLLKDYVVQQASVHREVLHWRVCVRGRQTPDPVLGVEDLGIAGHPRVPCISRALESQSEISIGTLVNPASRQGPGDEEVGLSPEARSRARTYARENQVSLPVALRRARPQDEGLLLLYPISRDSQPRTGAAGRPLFDPRTVATRGRTVVGMAAVLPYSTSSATVRWVVGSGRVAGG